MKVYVEAGYAGNTQKNGAASEVNKEFISHPTWAQHTLAAAGTGQVYHALPAFRFSCWIGRSANGNNNLLPWPHRSPDLTPCDLFIWGFVTDRVYVPPLHTPIQELRDRITHALQAITADMLHRV
jgi:hypothetical protein